MSRPYLLPGKRSRQIGWQFALGGLAGAFLLLTTTSLTHALETMDSENYSIQMGNFNMTSGTKSSSSFTVTDTVGELTPGQFDSAGYTVLSGFQYIYALPQFSFRILDLYIDLGVLQPNTFSSDSNQLVVTTRSAGYTILARAQHPLRSAESAEVPFTTCDILCTISSAQPWVNTSNTGFGFNVSGDHSSADFATADYYRPFANAEDNETAQTIASHASLVTDDTLTVTYKANVGQSQAAGTYITVVDFTAIPNY